MKRFGLQAELLDRLDLQIAQLTALARS